MSSFDDIADFARAYTGVIRASICTDATYDRGHAEFVKETPPEDSPPGVFGLPSLSGYWGVAVILS